MNNSQLHERQEDGLLSKESKDLLNSCIDSHKEVIIWTVDTNYRYMYFNVAHELVMKKLYQQDISIGMSILDCISIKQEKNRIKKNHDIALNGNVHSINEGYGINKTQFFKTTFSPMYNDKNEVVGVAGLARNTSDIIENENELRYEKELAQQYLDLAGTMILVLDPNGIITLMNKKGCNILELEEKDIVGKNWFDSFIPIEMRDKVKKVFYDVFLNVKKMTKYFENTIVTGENKQKIIKWENNILYDATGKISGIISSGEDVTDIRKKEEQLIHIGYYDQLTNLSNRRFFEEQLKRLDNPRNLPLSIIMGDVNGLKLTNDAFGHTAGDFLLKKVGEIILSCIRGNDIATRWGGDEFVILLPKSDTKDAKSLIKRIQRVIQKTTFEFGSISISFGVGTKLEAAKDMNDVFEIAEKRMYQRKLKQVEIVRGKAINAIMDALFQKSPAEKEHATKVAKYAAAIAKELRFPKMRIEDIRMIGLLHDIGKVSIDVTILEKNKSLNNKEQNIIEQHSLSGSRLLNSSHEYARLAAGVLHHHERIDGKGYPNGIKGDQIPIESKIIAVADSYDAMISKRPYRVGVLSKKEAVKELRENAGTQFDTSIVDIFIKKVLR